MRNCTTFHWLPLIFSSSPSSSLCCVLYCNEYVFSPQLGNLTISSSIPLLALFLVLSGLLCYGFWFLRIFLVNLCIKDIPYTLYSFWCVVLNGTGHCSIQLPNCTWPKASSCSETSHLSCAHTSRFPILQPTRLSSITLLMLVYNCYCIRPLLFCHWSAHVHVLPHPTTVFISIPKPIGIRPKP